MPIAEPTPAVGGPWPILSLDAVQLEQVLDEPDAPGAAQIGAAIEVIAGTPWTLTLRPCDDLPRTFSAVGPLAIESRADADLVQLQLFERATMPERIADAITVHPAAAPEGRIVRPARVPPALLRMLTDPGEGDGATALADILSAQPAAFTDALAHLERTDLLERVAADTPLAAAQLLVLTCGDHGRWAIWTRVDHREPWNVATARVQRVDDTRLAELVAETMGDLALPEADLVP